MNDVSSTIFTLTAAEETTFPVDGGRILHASFLNWLQQRQPELAARLHADNYARPYTLSPLQGEMVRRGRLLVLRKRAAAWFRLTGLEAQFNACVRETAEALGHGPAPDDPALQPGPALLTPAAHALARAASFEQLADEVIADTRAGRLTYDVVLDFQSPTCFMENKMSVPLPMPRYVFANLVNKWRRACEHDLPVADVEHFVDNLQVAWANIRTRPVDLGKYRRTGFVGPVRFALHPAMPEIYRQTLHLLAKFAFFSGVGSHTTMGMGQVLPDERSRRAGREQPPAHAQSADRAGGKTAVPRRAKTAP